MFQDLDNEGYKAKYNTKKKKSSIASIKLHDTCPKGTKQSPY